jgi:integrase
VTRYTSHHALRRILRKLADFGAPRTLAALIPKVAQPSPRAVIFTADQVSTLVSIAPPWLRLLILLCHDCALRAQTALALTRQHYRQDDRTIAIQSKRRQVAHVPVSGRVAALIDLAPVGSAPLIALLRGKPLGYHTARAAFVALLAQAGLPPTFHLHDLRRTSAEAVYRVTSDLRVVQTLLGHDHLQTTARYLFRDRAALTHTTLEAAISGGSTP